MRINNNLMAMNTHRQLGMSQANGANSMGKLSSGFRINKAGDDAAGLSISEKMRGQIRGLTQASRNAQDGISMIQTAEGDLSETHAILQRMRELAVQSSSDTNVNELDREAIQNEFTQLKEEVDRIGNTTEFNIQKLLNGAGVEKSDVAITTTTEGAKAGSISALQKVTAGSAKTQSSLVLVGRNAADAADANITFTTVDGGKFGGAKGSDILIEVKNGTAGQAAEYNEDTKRFTIYADTSANVTVADLRSSLTAGGFSASDITVAGVNGDTDILKPASVKTGLLAGGKDDVKEVQQFSIDQLFKNTGTNAENVLTVTTGTGAVVIDINAQSINDSSKEAQASAIVSYLNTQVNFNTNWTAKAIGDTVVMEQKTAGTGTMTSAVTTTATATKGDYNFTVTNSLEAGGKFVVDGQEIFVTDDANHADIASGKAIYAGASATEQADNLAVALTRNENLKGVYDVTAQNGKITLKQKTGQESNVEPEVVSYNKEGKFEAEFQIGANQGQSMNINVKDMRADALGISDVDLETKDGAKTAISTINDAINEVSNQRSALGHSKTD